MAIVESPLSSPTALWEGDIDEDDTSLTAILPQLFDDAEKRVVEVMRMAILPRFLERRSSAHSSMQPSPPGGAAPITEAAHLSESSSANAD